MALDFLQDVIEAHEQSERASQQVNFGKLTAEARYIQWVDSSPVDLTVAEYRALPNRDKSIELQFQVDIQEFQPALEFSYERKLRVGDADWWNILLPSIEETVGKGAKGIKSLDKILNQYVQVADVLQHPTERRPDPKYKTLKLLEVYDSREACHAAWAERFGGESTEPGGVNAPVRELPPNWEAGKGWDLIEGDFYEALGKIANMGGAARATALTGLCDTNNYNVPIEWANTKLNTMDEMEVPF